MRPSISEITFMMPNSTVLYIAQRYVKKTWVHPVPAVEKKLSENSVNTFASGNKKLILELWLLHLSGWLLVFTNTGEKYQNGSRYHENNEVISTLSFSF